MAVQFGLVWLSIILQTVDAVLLMSIGNLEHFIHFSKLLVIFVTCTIIVFFSTVLIVSMFNFSAKGLDHIAESILSYLDAKSLCSAQLVCREWYRVISEGMLWKKLIERMVLTDPLWKGLSERKKWYTVFFLYFVVAKVEVVDYVLQCCGHNYFISYFLAFKFWFFWLMSSKESIGWKTAHAQWMASVTRGGTSPKNPPRLLANAHSTRNRILACFSMYSLQSCKQKWLFAKKKYLD